MGIKNNSGLLTTEIATRARFEDAAAKMMSVLPDPDAIFTENNNDYTVYRDLLTDPHLMATIQQRKMQVMQMDYQIDYNGKNAIKEDVENFFTKLQVSEIIGDIMDAIFFGYVVQEIEWGKEGKILLPKKLIGKPQEWFIFDKRNELRMRKYKNGYYFFEEGEKLPPYKFILTQHKPTFTNPYGEKILSRCYWPVQLKKGGIEFWQLMMERYGMPYLVGRYPNTFTEPQKQEFLEQLEDMVKDNITIFEESLGIDVKESPKYEIGQLYENLVSFHNKEISKAVLTVTLTTEVEGVGSYKASEIHKEMLSYLGVSDKKLVESSLNKLIDYFCELNYGDVERPRIKLNKKEAIVEESAERDKLLSEIGVKFTRDYFKKRYNLQDGDFEISNQ
ncbi:MAG: DUF935 family protein [Ignavibacteriae bacterium]|nr:DUF935 family protein [Ignavibacteriota bacterium]MCE7855098.1 DUF935 family protein [Ignavibacteria bacterium CHB3]GJQ44137.1 MAG: hypothetical protein JETCAE03_36350 [Ignavibacteriaceae bacterium]